MNPVKHPEAFLVGQYVENITQTDHLKTMKNKTFAEDTIFA